MMMGRGSNDVILSEAKNRLGADARDSSARNLGMTQGCGLACG
jgi:hypothetical protein